MGGPPLSSWNVKMGGWRQSTTPDFFPNQNLKQITVWIFIPDSPTHPCFLLVSGTQPVRTAAQHFCFGCAVVCGAVVPITLSSGHGGAGESVVCVFGEGVFSCRCGYPPLVVWTPSPLVGMGTLGWVSRRGSIGLGAVAVESAGVSARGSAALTHGRSTVLAGDGGVVGEPHGWPPFS